MTVLGIFVALLGCLAALPALYLATLAVSSFFYTQRLGKFAPHARLVVLVPAHDEELLISRTIESLLRQSYPRSLFKIVVIADNCSDQTATVALAAGADEVLTRYAPDARGKGQALRWAIDQILAADDAPDAIASIDADTTADPDLLLGLVERFESGAGVVQADYRTFGNGSAAESLRETAFMLNNWVRPAGRNVLGLTAFLVGNGILLGASALHRQPWAAFSAVEDREYTLDLQYHGIPVAFAGAVAVHAPTAPSAAAAATQQQRWEGGWASLLRSRFLRLLADGVRGRSLALLMAAADLAVPPLGLLAAFAVCALAVSAIPSAFGAWSAWPVAPALVALMSIAFYVVAGLVAVRAPRSAYAALLHAPILVLRKPFSLGRTLRFRGDSWVRTERVSRRPARRG